MAIMKPVPQISAESQTALPRLSRRQKAAIIIRLLGQAGHDVPLADLPETMQAGLAETMSAMRLVDRQTMAAVVDEFLHDMEHLGVTFPPGLKGALSVLEGKISPEMAARMRREAGVRQVLDPWPRLRALAPRPLVKMLEGESIEVAAVVLSKIDTAKAAQALAEMDGPRARRVTYAISQTAGITPDAVERIGLALVSQLDAAPPRAFSEGPEARIGAILNQSPSSMREQVLAGLDETDQDFAARVRKSLFTFAHIPERLAPRDVPRLTRAVEQDVLVTALAAATDEENAAVVQFILSNMSQRMAEALREQIAERGKVRLKVGEEAMATMAQVLRDLQQQGEITFVEVPEEEEA